MGFFEYENTNQKSYLNETSVTTNTINSNNTTSISNSTMKVSSNNTTTGKNKIRQITNFVVGSSPFLLYFF